MTLRGEGRMLSENVRESRGSGQRQGREKSVIKAEHPSDIASPGEWHSGETVVFV